MNWELLWLLIIVAAAAIALTLVWLDTPTQGERRRTEDEDGWWDV